MLHTPIQYGLLASLAIALGVAAITDLKRRQIDNSLNIAVALGALLYWWAGDLAIWPDIALHLGVALFAFVLAAGLFAIGQMGGGDAKLISALALWFQPADFLQLLLVMAVLGYALTMGLGAIRISRSGGATCRTDTVSLVALALIAALMIALFAGVVTMPLPPSVRAAASQSLPVAAFVMQIPVVLFAMATFQAIRIFRQRQVNVAAPYGVAIAGAGLWTIAAQVSAAQPFPAGAM